MCEFDKDFNNHFKKILDTNILKLLNDLDYELLTLDKKDRELCHQL